MQSQQGCAQIAFLHKNHIMHIIRHLLIILLVATVPVLSFGQDADTINPSKPNDMSKKTLVAYFSCTGNTRHLAKKIAEITNGDLFEIKPAVPYTEEDLDWRNSKSRSSVEMKDKSSRPAIAEKVENMDQYDVVYVGFPIWWYIAPTIINTFLESYDFSGKTVIPFCTSGGSNVGDTERYLHPSCSAATIWKPAKRFQTSVSKDVLTKWIENN